MNSRTAWMTGLVWAAGSVAAGWAIGDLEVTPLLAAAWGALLWLFVTLWQGSSLGGALLTFGVPALMVVAGGLLFGLGYRSVGTALMIGSGAAFALLAGWVLTHWGSGKYVAGAGTADEAESPLESPQWKADEPWLVLSDEVLPGFPTKEAIWPFAEFGAINPDAGIDDDARRSRWDRWDSD